MGVRGGGTYSLFAAIIILSALVTHQKRSIYPVRSSRAGVMVVLSAFKIQSKGVI